jgi:carbon starvation protein
VFAIWCEVPIALMLGYFLYRRKSSTLVFSLIALALMYVTVIAGAYLPLSMPALWGIGPVVTWSIILLVYAYAASVLPVWRLLQPRDYMNGLELFVALVLLAIGTLATHPEIVAPAVSLHPAGAPPMMPFLFVTIACGAISGFHSLVASGTTSKQICNEGDACVVGYGSMLMEGLLAVFVIIAVAGGIGLGTMTLDDGTVLTGSALWQHHYASWAAAQGLDMKLKAFVDGSANMLAGLGIPHDPGSSIALAIMGVFVTSFAATTLDTATRLQRYVIGEFGKATGIKPLENRHLAALTAVVTAGVLALHDGVGAGGMILWPLFGATNQLLACLALLVITTYLKKKGKAIWYTLVPAALMFVVTGLAMAYNIRDYAASGLPQLHLLLISIVIVVLEVWMVIEAVRVVGHNDARETASA